MKLVKYGSNIYIYVCICFVHFEKVHVNCTVLSVHESGKLEDHESVALLNIYLYCIAYYQFMNLITNWMD
jgi:hypothetical protein